MNNLFNTNLWSYCLENAAHATLNLSIQTSGFTLIATAEASVATSAEQQEQSSCRLYWQQWNQVWLMCN